MQQVKHPDCYVTEFALLLAVSTTQVNFLTILSACLADLW